MSSYEDKVLTDTPMLDEIVYNCKYMIKEGIVLKDSEEADSLETESSMVKSDLYIASIEGFSTFKMYKYTKSDIIAANPFANSMQIQEWYDSNDRIPEEYRDILIANKRASYIESYDEENSYYRTLAGLPPYGEAGAFLKEEWIPESLKKHVDIYTPIFAMDHDLLIALENMGVIDKAIAEYPEYKYLRYVGKRRMNIYECRKAGKFAPLYVPECPISDIRTRFQELLEMNRTIYLKCYYDEAYSYKSDYYDKFMIIMIILQTFNDMIIELPEYIIRKDVFDIRTIQYLFEASGVEFFPEIPIRYQVSLVRNLNKLIKYKSSDTCIVDIVKLFGFDNIEVFKYYILKSRKKDSDGKYKFGTVKNDLGIEVDDVDNNYELSFLKAGLNELADDAIKSQANVFNYDEIVNGDDYWFGDLDEDTVRHDILEHEFNILRTKYMSIKSVYSMQEYTFQMSYFIGLLMNNNIDKSLLLFNVPSMNMTMNIMDAFIFMYALAHIYYGTEDIISTEVDDTLKVLGFNFEADMSELAEYLWTKGVKTFEDMGISGWQNPRNGIFSFNQLMTIYTKNKEIYDHVMHMMVTADNKRVYDLYKKIYQSLMITRINLDYFVIDDNGTVATSFAQYLEYKNTDLYAKYADLVNLPDDRRNDSIADTIYNICCVIEEYIDVNKVPYLFSGLPAASIEAVKVYVMDIINFFKSFKVSILDLNTVYVLDDKIMCKVFIEDDWRLKSLFTKKFYFPYNDKLKSIVSKTTSSDNMSPTDHYYISRIRCITHKDEATSMNKDSISRMGAQTEQHDYMTMRDGVSKIVRKYTWINEFRIRDRGKPKSIITSRDDASIKKETYSIRYI